MSTTFNDKETQQDNPYQAEGENKSSRGCCLYGCLIIFVLGLVVVVGGGFSAYWWVQGQVNRYTADAPANLPIVELSDEERAEIKGRVDGFKATIDAGETPEDLVLTANEINAMISADDDMKGKVYVKIQDGEITGDVSIPTDGIPGGKGRYFNASATFDVSLENGVLIVTLTDAEVKGEKIPQEILDAMGKENLAKDIYKDPEVAETLRRIESVSIEDDKIILKPRVAEESATEQEMTEEVVPPAVQVPSEAEATSEPTDAEGDTL